MATQTSHPHASHSDGEPYDISDRTLAYAATGCVIMLLVLMALAIVGIWMRLPA